MVCSLSAFLPTIFMFNFQASELQTSMIETMEATEIEKQRHHSTRMEALVRLAELEVCAPFFRRLQPFLLPCFK
jgi:hypothetical protein